MNREIIESFNCPICLDICKDPVESSCCKNLFCEECANKLRECSFCRRKCSYQKSILAKRLIDKLHIQCEYCKFDTTRGNIAAHYLNCEEYPFLCPIDKCDKNIPKSKILDHICSNHKSQWMNRVNDILNIFDDSAKVYNASAVYNQPSNIPCMNSSNDSFKSNNVSNDYNNNNVCIDKKLNSRGFPARIGKSGKYYCSQELDGPFCMCCNDSCGPTNGCNCSSCMKLDIITRGLPKGWLVNRDGHAARKGVTGLFYCGRCVLIGTPNCDGYCGPTDGPNCPACKKLDVMTKNNGRYKQLV